MRTLTRRRNAVPIWLRASLRVAILRRLATTGAACPKHSLVDRTLHPLDSPRMAWPLSRRGARDTGIVAEALRRAAPVVAIVGRAACCLIVAARNMKREQLQPIRNEAHLATLAYSV